MWIWGDASASMAEPTKVAQAPRVYVVPLVSLLGWALAVNFKLLRGVGCRPLRALSLFCPPDHRRGSAGLPDPRKNNPDDPHQIFKC